MQLKQSIFLPFLKLLIWIYDFLGKVIDVVSIKLNGDVHPKHHLMKYYNFFLENIHPESTILDIGCGNGYLTYKVAEKATKVTGIDTEKANINLAQKLHSKENIEYILGDATKYPFSEKYHFIILSNVLEHIENRIEFLQNISKLSPKILIRIPMLDRDWLTLLKKELGMFYFCDTTHFTEYTEESFQKEMLTANLAVESTTIRFGEIWAIVKTT